MQLLSLDLHIKILGFSRTCNSAFYTILILLLPLGLSSQVNNYRIENFFIEEGFPVIRVLDINQDQEGIIWFCSEKQLHSFNGSQFNLKLEFSNSDFFLSKILFDNNGNKWLLDLNRTNSYSFHSIVNEIKIFDKNNKELNFEEYLGLGDIKVDRLYQSSSGIISFKVGKRFYSFDKTKKELILPEETISLVFCNDEQAIINNPEGAFVINLATNEILHEFKDLFAYKVRDHEGKFYLQFVNGSLYSYNIESNQSELISTSILKINDLFSDFLFDKSGKIWVVRLRSLTLYDYKENKKLDFTNSTSFNDITPSGYKKCTFW